MKNLGYAVLGVFVGEAIYDGLTLAAKGVDKGINIIKEKIEESKERVTDDGNVYEISH